MGQLGFMLAGRFLAIFVKLWQGLVLTGDHI